MAAHAKRRVLLMLEATTGGTRRHLFDLATHLDRDRFDVSILCATRRDPDFLADLDILRARGIYSAVVPMTRAIAPHRDLLCFMRILAHLRRRRYDVVHTHSAKAGFLGRLAARARGVPRIVHTPHVFPFEMGVEAWRRALYLRLERLASACCDRVVCICPHEKQAGLRARVAPAEKLVVIENGLDEGFLEHTTVVREAVRAELGFGPEDVVAGAVGRLCPQKGHADLLRALAPIMRDMPRVKLLLLGDGPLRGRLDALAGKLLIRDRCLLHHATDRMLPYYTAMDMMVFSSRWEGLPYSLLEAAAVGLPVAAYRVGGLGDSLQDGRTALLAAPGDIAGLERACRRLAADARLRARLGAEAGRELPRRYRLRDMVRRIESLYEEGTV